MSFSTDTAWLEKWAPSLDEMAAVVRGEAHPTRATFMALSYFIQDLLAQHERMAAELEKRDKNKAKRERKASH